MAASSKFDLLSSSDRQSYSCGPRGPNPGTLLARSGSFHVSMESPILSSVPSTPRSNSTVTQGDVENYFQCLRVDPKSMVVDPKFHRHSELKKIISVGLGISPDIPPPISSKGKLPSSLYPEDLKRTKAGLRACAAKGRERRKIFTEALSVFNKFFPTIPTKKRSRSDMILGDRATTNSSVDRFGLGAKVGIHATTNALEAEQQRSEDRANATTVNKRTRTSLMDARVSTLTRPPTNVDFNKDAARVGKSGAILSEDHGPMGVHGWQNPKMKKKRSGIKPDASPSKLSVKNVGGIRELKQGLKHRLVSDSRSRINESDASRMVTGTGVVGQGKLDGAFYHSGSGVRSAVKSDQDSTDLHTQNKDFPSSSDKERVKLKPVNKVSLREDQNSASPTSGIRLAPSARGPRSNSAAFLKSSPIAQRPISSNDWEVSQCNRPSTSSGASTQKRTFCARSSSPPVAHWAGQRPQKISRTARRTNFSSIVPSNDDSPSFDTNSENRNDNDLMFPRHHSSDSPQQKLKGDNTTMAALSDSEESGVAEKKPKEKKKFLQKKTDKEESAEKASIFAPLPKKNKLVSGEELHNGIHKQGRTNRNLASSSRSLMSKVDKFGNVRTAKQLRTSKKSLHKADSKVGRPPTRKLSDRKAYMRNKNSVVHSTADFLGSSDGQEELLAAAKVVASSSAVHTNSYWRHMEHAFRFISEADTAFLMSQLEESMPLSSLPVLPSVDGNKFLNNFNEFGLAESRRYTSFPSTEADAHEHFGEQLMSETTPDGADPLFKRLLGALITDDDDVNRDVETGDFQVNPLSYEGYPTDLNPDFGSLDQALAGTSHAFMSGTWTDCGINGTGRMMGGLGEYEASALMGVQTVGGLPTCNPMYNRAPPNSDLIPIMETTEYQYTNMTIHERLWMELQSFGIVPDEPQIRPNNPNEFDQELRHLEDQYRALGYKKKGIVSKVLTSASGIREVQEKEFERCAMERLTTMAYEKYMGCLAGKSKPMKQAAIAFVLRILDWCHKYEATGTSCFSESSFKNMFNAALNRLSEAQFLDIISDNESNRGGGCTSSLGLPQNTEIYSSNSLLPESSFSLEQTMGNGDASFNKVKKRELSLDDVGGSAIYTPPNGLSPVVRGCVKGKRSDRDREGKGSKNGVAKVGRPAGGSTKGVRKPKSKAKQKMAPVSLSVNGVLVSESPPKAATLPKSTEKTGADPEAADLTGLQIPGIDIDLDAQGEDLASWLNIDDDGLQGDDFMGLEIPMDDLADVHMMF